MKKYTAIYIEFTYTKGQVHQITKMKRMHKSKKETVLDMLHREQVEVAFLTTTIFLFKGWPKLQGEDGEEGL